MTEKAVWTRVLSELGSETWVEMDIPSRGNSMQAKRHKHLCSRRANGWVWKDYNVVERGVAGYEVAKTITESL